MGVWRCLFGLATLVALTQQESMNMALDDNVTLVLTPQLTGGFKVTLTRGDNEQVIGHMGRTVVQPFTTKVIDGGVEVHISNANLTILTVYDKETSARGVKISWDAPSATRLEDCIDFGLKQWYGGPMQVDQLYPIQSAPRTYSPYVSTEKDNGAIVERYWLNSAGEYIYVHPEVPLFVDYNNLLANHLCFGAQIAEPYSSKRQHTPLVYDIWFLPNAKEAHKHAVENYLGQPSDVPDFRMVQHPIWSTWAQYARDINDTKLIEFAQQINDFGFNNSQLEIDDLWEVCYGSFVVDEKKFPNFTQVVEDIKSLGYRVTLWVHPFINSNCEPWYSDALKLGYLALDEAGSPNVTWWNSNGTKAAYVDFTNPDAAEWWYQRVKKLQDTYGIDSFKFDAGESSFSPQIAVQNGDIDLQPHHIVEEYVNTCARFGDMVEVRAGFRTQNLPIFVRMVDRDSIWGTNNGLPTVVTTTLQMNLNGYTLVLPDMIGGNGYNLNHEQADLPTKELFIRWVQATTFLPVMQFSFAPWNFDEETLEISQKYARLHAEYADRIYAAMQASVTKGTPVNGPLWWLDPTDEEALVIWDQYLLGEDVIVAPVLSAGARARDVYLPGGEWLEAGDAARPHAGPGWLPAHPAPLDTLLYFVRKQPARPAAAPPPPLHAAAAAAALATVLGLLVNAVL